MGIGDFVEKGKDLASEHSDTVKDGIDKAGDFVDEKTGGEHTEHIEKGEQAAKDYVDKLDDE